MRFCGGPLDSESSVFAFNGKIIGCAMAFACCCLSYFCLRRKMQCRIRFSSIDIDTSDYDKIHKKLVSFKGGTFSSSFLGKKFEDASTEKKYLDIN